MWRRTRDFACLLFYSATGRGPYWWPSPSEAVARAACRLGKHSHTWGVSAGELVLLCRWCRRVKATGEKQQPTPEHHKLSMMAALIIRAASYWRR